MAFSIFPMTLPLVEGIDYMQRARNCGAIRASYPTSLPANIAKGRAAISPPRRERNSSMGFFDLNIFNRCKLMIDSDAEYIARCADALKRAGIPHEVSTRRMRNYTPNMMRNGNMVDLGISQKTMNPVDDLYTYTIWVPRKQLEQAKAVVSI